MHNNHFLYMCTYFLYIYEQNIIKAKVQKKHMYLPQYSCKNVNTKIKLSHSKITQGFYTYLPSFYPLFSNNYFQANRFNLQNTQKYFSCSVIFPPKGSHDQKSHMTKINKQAWNEAYLKRS